MPDQFNPWDFFQNNNMRSVDEMSNQDFSWIEDHVKGIMNNAMPEHMRDSKHHSGSLRYQVFEAHHYMIARIDLPDDVLPGDVQVFLNVNNLKVKTGERDQSETIKLPANGNAKGSEALFKDGVLEVRIPKKHNNIFHEIPVQY